MSRMDDMQAVLDAAEALQKALQKAKAPAPVHRLAKRVHIWADMELFEPGSGSDGSVPGMICHLLRQMPGVSASAGEIAAELGLDLRTILSHLSNLTKQGRVQREGQGGYGTAYRYFIPEAS